MVLANRLGTQNLAVERPLPYHWTTSCEWLLSIIGIVSSCGIMYRPDYECFQILQADIDT